MRDDAAIFGGHLLAALGPLTIAALLSPLRDASLGDVAPPVVFVLFAEVVVVAGAVALGGPVAGLIGTTCAALSIDFLYVRPYLDLKYRPDGDLWPVAFIAATGLAIVAVSWRGWRQRPVPEAPTVDPDASPSRHIDRIVQLIADGTDIRDLASAMQAELTSLLLARGCRFEPDERAPASLRLERSGAVTGRGIEPTLPPAELAVVVELGEQQLGRFIVDPTPDVIVPLGPRLVAVMLTDHFAAAIARRHPTASPVPRPVDPPRG